MPIGTHEFEYLLDNMYFKNIDGTEVQKGKVTIKLIAKRTLDTFELKFDINGVVQIPCDRCLDEMDHEVFGKETLYVKFGKEFSEENGNVVIIPETEGELNLAWFLYEFVALLIPIKHIHPPGRCNKGMSSKLNKHMAHSSEDEESDDTYSEEIEPDENLSEEQTDPRWDDLKKLIDNN